MSLSHRITIPGTAAAYSAFSLLGTAIFVVIAVSGLSSVAIGESRYDRVNSSTDLVTDIGSLPKYVFDAYREAYRLLNMNGAPGSHKARLNTLHKDFDDRKASGGISGAAAGEADRFWSEVETKFLPAIEKNDKAAAAESFERLSAIYAKCCESQSFGGGIATGGRIATANTNRPKS